MASKIIKTIFQFRRATAEEWKSYEHLAPAEGEPCFVIDENILKIGDGKTPFKDLEPINGVKVEVTADGNSVVLEDNVFKLAGFDEADPNAQPRKTADGKIEWVVPSTETLEDLQSAVTDLQTDVSKLQEIVGAVECEDPLVSKVATIEGAIGILNGDATIEGSVQKTVADAINEFATKVSDDKVVNSYKELIDYVAEHGSEVTAMTGDIATLNGLVGTTSVEDQIAAAVADKVVAEEGKSLVADTLIEKLEGVEENAQVNKIESIKVGDTIMEIVDKQVTIPLGAGLKGSDEIEIAEDSAIKIKSMSWDKLMDGEDEIVMDGGGASI